MNAGQAQKPRISQRKLIRWPIARFGNLTFWMVIVPARWLGSVTPEDRRTTRLGDAPCPQICGNGKNTRKTRITDLLLVFLAESINSALPDDPCCRRTTRRVRPCGRAWIRTGW